MRSQNLTRDNPSGLSGSVHSEAGFNVGYRQNEVDAIRLAAGDESDGKGTLSMLHVLANTYAEYDFEIGVIPYFGLGVGYAMVEIDAHNKPQTLQIDSNDNAFLWNVMAGVSIPVSDITTFGVGYRYHQSEDLECRARLDTVPPAPGGQTTRQLDSEYDAHEFVFSIRYSF